MSPTTLLDTPLTLIQAQQATALDDLLRFIVVSDGCKWDAIEKRMTKVSYEGLYEVCVAETGSKATRGARVEYVQRYFRQHDFTRQATAGIPNAVFHELIAAWKARAKDDWTSTTLHKLPSSLSLPTSASSTSISPTVKKVSRITASCGIKTTHYGNPMKALNIIALELDGDLPYHEYIEAGFGARSMVQTEKFGDWKLLLGPGTAIRRACSACWNCKAISSASAAVTTPILLCEDVWQGDELFIASGQVEDHTCQCPHPEHDERKVKRAHRRQPTDCLVTVNDMSVWAAEYLAHKAQISSPKDICEVQVNTASNELELSTQSCQAPDTQPIHPALPSRIILKIPSHIRSIPLRTRKLDLAIHRQIIRSHILLKAQRITRTVQRKMQDAQFETQQTDLQLQKKKLEHSLAIAREGRSRKALVIAKETIKENRTIISELKKKDEARQVLAEEAVKKLEMGDKERESLKNGLRKENQRVTDLVLRNNSLEAQVRIAAENIQSAVESARTQAEDNCRAAHRIELDTMTEQHEIATEFMKENWKGKEKEWENRVQTAVNERTSLGGQYQQELVKQHQHAQSVIARLEEEIHRLRSGEAGQAGLAAMLDQANSKIADLQSDLDTTWTNLREVTSELNRLKRGSGRQSSGIGLAGGEIRSQNVHSLAQGLQLRYSGSTHFNAAFPEPISAQTPLRPTYLASPYVIPTPPGTASPTNSQRSFSPGELVIGTTRVGLWPEGTLGKGSEQFER